MNIGRTDLKYGKEFLYLKTILTCKNEMGKEIDLILEAALDNIISMKLKLRTYDTTIH